MFAPVPRLRSGFSTASSAGVWGTWPVRAPPDCGGGSQAKMRRSGIHIVEPAQARQRLAEATDETTYNNTDEEEKRTRRRRRRKKRREKEEKRGGRGRGGEGEKGGRGGGRKRRKRRFLMRPPEFPPEYIIDKINLELVSHECAPHESRGRQAVTSEMSSAVQQHAFPARLCFGGLAAERNSQRMTSGNET